MTVLVQIVDREPAMPVQVAAQPGDVFAHERVLYADPRHRTPPVPGLLARVYRDQPAVGQQGTSLRGSPRERVAAP